MHILHIIGASPNFMKAAPVIRALTCCDAVRQTLVHTGQHYDPKMSEVFFRDLEIPEPDINLAVGSGTHAQQTAQIISQLEPLLVKYLPDLVLLYGDVNSTLAAALVCAKLLIPVGHVEAGLRSFDRKMPEEINRLVTDQLAHLLFTPSLDGDENLLREGVAGNRIHFVGNVMIDSLVRLLGRAEKSTVLDELNLLPRSYALVTLHRPSNVDDPERLATIMAALDEISFHLPIIFPIHPRTRQRLQYADNQQCSKVRIIDPLGYVDFLTLQRLATVVITDSGGVQEETTYLGVPCLTIRENTERPVTVSLGTNRLVGTDSKRLTAEALRIINGDHKRGQLPALWDGHAAERIAQAILTWQSSQSTVPSSVESIIC